MTKIREGTPVSENCPIPYLESRDKKGKLKKYWNGTINWGNWVWLIEGDGSIIYDSPEHLLKHFISMNEWGKKCHEHCHPIIERYILNKKLKKIKLI